MCLVIEPPHASGWNLYDKGRVDMTDASEGDCARVVGSQNTVYGLYGDDAIHAGGQCRI